MLGPRSPTRQWRNWQTHQLEGLAGATPWRFESSLPHHISGPEAVPTPAGGETEMSELEKIARAMVAPHKGILAADESSPTIKKRFDSIRIESTEESRRAYRELLFTTPGVEQFVSGVILYDETIRQKAVDGTPFAQLLERRGILPGIKVDAGAKPLAGAPGELGTEGLDKRRERLAEYRGMGARFAKWRAVIDIGDGI